MTRTSRARVVILFALGALAALLLLPLQTRLRLSTPDPAATYLEAVDRFGALRVRDSIALYPGCESALLTHGARTARVDLLLHGLTNCPRQFHEFGLRLFTLGDNVLIPRVVRHGRADRMTRDLANLTADEMAAGASEALDLACGLGDTVCVIGLSTSGITAAWLAQHRPEVSRAVVIAPAFAPKGTPPWRAAILARALDRLPNLFLWWDGKAKDRLAGPPQCYPRFSTRAVGEAYRLGEIVRGEARTAAPAAGHVVTVTTEADRAIDNRFVRELAASWRAHGASVEERSFPRVLNIHHDMIDPQQVNARIEAVYPALIEWLRGTP